MLSWVPECSTEAFLRPPTQPFNWNSSFSNIAFLQDMEPRREVTPSQSLPSSACWMEAGGAAQLGDLACAPSTSGISQVCGDPPAPPGKTRQIQTDKANKWQLHMLIMLINRRSAAASQLIKTFPLMRSTRQWRTETRRPLIARHRRCLLAHSDVSMLHPLGGC